MTAFEMFWTLPQRLGMFLLCAVLLADYLNCDCNKKPYMSYRPL